MARLGTRTSSQASEGAEPQAPEEVDACILRGWQMLVVKLQAVGTKQGICCCKSGVTCPLRPRVLTMGMRGRGMAHFTDGGVSPEKSVGFQAPE